VRTPAQFRHALNIALAPVLAIAGLTAAASPADATPVTANSWLDVLVDDENNVFNVCVSGDIPAGIMPPAPGEWTLRITGARLHDSSTPWIPIDDVPTWTSTSFTINPPHCQVVYTWGYPYGQLDVDFGWVSAGQYVMAHSSGGGFWTPELGLHPFSVNPTS